MNIFDPTTLLGIHSLVSVIALIVGIPVMIGLLRGPGDARGTVGFLIAAVVASVSGFGLPAKMLLPSHIVGILSLLVLAAAIFAEYRYRFSGMWRWVHAVGVVAAEFFLVFVAIAQSFQKVPALVAFANGSPTPFIASAAVALVVFVVIGIVGMRTFKPAHAAN